MLDNFFFYEKFEHVHIKKLVIIYIFITLHCILLNFITFYYYLLLFIYIYYYLVLFLLLYPSQLFYWFLKMRILNDDP